MADHNNNTARWGLTLIVVALTTVMISAFILLVSFTPASAKTIYATTLCGDGSVPDYSFTYALQQTYWVVNWENYASEQAVVKADAILNQLNEDAIAQTMILFQSQDQVGNRVNCAVHFLRYMKLGLPSGERKDNGFVFLIVVEPNAIDVHYGVGLGLPALTASELTDINRAAEAAYQSSHDMDQALLTLAQEFDKVARSNYEPLADPTTVAQTNNDTPQTPAGPLDIFTICGQLCLGLLVLLFLLWIFFQMARRGIRFGGGGFGSGGGGFGGGGWGGGGGGRGWGGGGGGRGGSGSGRSGRGN